MFRFAKQRWWPRGGGADLYRVEQVLATARVVLGLVLVASLALTPQEEVGAIVRPGVPIPILLFFAYSLLLLTVIRIRGRMSPMLGLGMHVFDLTWAGLGTSIAGGRLGAFSIFNLFALVAAAYRWGLWETFATAAAVAVLVAVQTTLAGGMTLLGSGFADVMISGGVAFWLINLGMLAFLLGYLGEQEKILRYEASSAAGLMASVQAERGLRESLRTAAAEMLRIFSARQILIVSAETSTGRVFLNASIRAGDDGDAAHASVELPGDLRAQYLFSQMAAWSAVRSVRSRDDSVETLAIDADGHRQANVVNIPSSFLEGHAFRTLLAASFAFDDEWTGGIFLLDVPDGATRFRAMSFLRTLVRDAGPALYGLYLVRRLRNQVGAAERARVARELHDGVIQALIGVEMRLDVLRRQMPTAASVVESELSELQQVIRQEVLDLRDLLQHMRPPDPGPNIANHLSDMVDRFRRDTGIAANFVSNPEAMPLGAATRRQIVRIVQEALVNIRKHSGARNVIIRMQLDAEACRLTVDDDGQGYDFAGRRTMEELDEARRGPVVIKERVRDMRGTIAIESVPGRGSRLDIVVPRRL